MTVTYKMGTSPDLMLRALYYVCPHLGGKGPFMEGSIIWTDSIATLKSQRVMTPVQLIFKPYDP